LSSSTSHLSFLPAGRWTQRTLLTLAISTTRKRKGSSLTILIRNNTNISTLLFQRDGKKRSAVSILRTLPFVLKIFCYSALEQIPAQTCRKASKYIVLSSNFYLTLAHAILKERRLLKINEGRKLFAKQWRHALAVNRRATSLLTRGTDRVGIETAAQRWISLWNHLSVENKRLLPSHGNRFSVHRFIEVSVNLFFPLRCFNRVIFHIRLQFHCGPCFGDSHSFVLISEGGLYDSHAVYLQFRACSMYLHTNWILPRGVTDLFEIENYFLGTE